MSARSIFRNFSISPKSPAVAAGGVTSRAGDMGNSFRSRTTWTCASQAPRGTSKATVVFGFGPAAETRFKLAIETHKALAVLNSARRVSMGLQSLRFLRGVPPHSGNGRHRPRHPPILRSHSTDRSGEAPSDQRGADPRIIRPVVVLV